jgi:GNAT superfamily N-acetyltransferase
LTIVSTHLPAAANTARPQPPEIHYALEPDLGVNEFLAVFRASTLAERRPVERPDVLEAMLRGADLIVTARLVACGKLVGVSRAISDFAYCTYLSDLAVDGEYQRLGIGKELLKRTHEAAGLHTTLILLAAPRARDYYPHIGMKHHDSCWMLPRYAPPETLPVHEKHAKPPSSRKSLGQSAAARRPAPDPAGG